MRIIVPSLVLSAVLCLGRFFILALLALFASFCRILSATPGANQSEPVCLSLRRRDRVDLADVVGGGVPRPHRNENSDIHVPSMSMSTGTPPSGLMSR